MPERKAHWDAIFGGKSSPELTWFQPHLTKSLELIQATGLSQDAPILDLGCGDSTLVDDLLESGYTDLTAMDVSSLALERSRERLGSPRRAGDLDRRRHHPVGPAPREIPSLA